LMRPIARGCFSLQIRRFTAQSAAATTGFAWDAIKAQAKPQILSESRLSHY